jgi:hypothetical protein
MNPRTSRLSLARLAVLANAIYWMVFAILFVVGSYPYRTHRPAFEEVTPDYIFFGRALRMLDTSTGIGLPPAFLKVTYAIQSPSAYAARPFFWYFNHYGITVDHQYWGTSLGGYYLVLVCLLSFLQWYVVGFLVDYLRTRFSVSSGVSGESGESGPGESGQTGRFL